MLLTVLRMISVPRLFTLLFADIDITNLVLNLKFYCSVGEGESVHRVVRQPTR